MKEEIEEKGRRARGEKGERRYRQKDGEGKRSSSRRRLYLMLPSYYTWKLPSVSTELL